MGSGGSGKIMNALDPLELFSGDKPEAPAAPPAPPPAAVMPLVDDEASRKAQKRRTAEMAVRGGRLSTILTEGGADKLGA